jgi:TRAP-type C4-dicarboxylate transport system substrate-binding protein
MKRKSGMIIAGILIAAFAVTIFMPVSATAGAIKLTYANFPPAPTFPCVQMERWKTEVEKRTNGAVAIQTFPGGTLLGAKAMMDGVIAGQADIGNLCMAYQGDRFVVTNAIALPVGFTSARSGSLALHDLYNKYKPKAFSKVKVLAMFTTSPSHLMTKMPVKTLKDLKGVALRASGGAAAILKAWGANQVGMPQSAVPEAMQKGTIQGQFTSFDVLKDFKYAEMCKYAVVLNGPVYAFSVVMNMDKWNSLPKNVQKVMDSMVREQAEWTGNYLDNHVKESVSWSRNDQNVKFINLAPAEKAKWDKLIEPVAGNWVKAKKEKGIPAKAIAADVAALAKKYN